jgi:hypothetical protein
MVLILNNDCIKHLSFTFLDNDSIKNLSSTCVRLRRLLKHWTISPFFLPRLSDYITLYVNNSHLIGKKEIFIIMGQCALMYKKIPKIKYLEQYKMFGNMDFMISTYGLRYIIESIKFIYVYSDEVPNARIYNYDYHFYVNPFYEM